MSGCIAPMKTGSADAWEREWIIQRRQSARTVRLMPAQSVGRWPAWFAGLLAGDWQVQTAGHFEVEGDVGDVDTELGDVPFKASQVVNQCVEVGEVPSPTRGMGSW